MPKDTSIKKIMIIGSGPIIIGQAAEFDYAGTQACRTLQQEGVESVLLNSNPATIMTDAEMATKVYLEPLQTKVVERILLEEGCDSLLASLGGQTGLNFAMELTESGFLAQHHIRLLGTSAEGIKRGEDREAFRSTMEAINIPCIPSGIAHTIEEALALAESISYPVIIRPAFTLGGTGGGIVNNSEELKEIAETGLEASRVHQILVEKSIAGWKEIEFEAVRDADGNAITICSMENFDPVGVHTGDSIVFAPALTLNDHELQLLRSASMRIVQALEIVGGCNVQFALHPTDGSYAVIEVNPRLSRSSALASKATGYPIAKVAAHIALGYRLDEIRNEVTGCTWAAAEPVVDYVVTKIPKWPFDKFVHADRALGTQMKATGEIMSIGNTFKASLMKAIRSLELHDYGLRQPALFKLSPAELQEQLQHVNDRRLFAVAEALRRGQSLDLVYQLTRIDRFFLGKVRELVLEEERLAGQKSISDRELRQAWQDGLCDRRISDLTGLDRELLHQRRQQLGLVTHYKMVDTCAGEFEASTPYFYSCTDPENEARRTERRKIVVLGSGPIRIGQGIEFDYCSVHCVQELKKLGYEAIIINNNPETVSTDFDTSDRLYFEPLTEDDVRAVLENEQPDGVICQFGGQTAIKLIKAVSDWGYRILGTSADGVDRAEDRERFDEVLNQCRISRPQGHTIFSTAEAQAAARQLGYPVLLRPSYVLGGQGMQICYNDRDIEAYMAIINLNTQEHPILVDKYLMGVELEVDAISDGVDILIPGIMEHLERAGIHSGDSISIFPAYIPDKHRETIIRYTRLLAQQIGVIGLINIQFILYNDEVYVLEVNPRSSRTVPYISKVTGLPIVRLATEVMLGRSVSQLGYGEDLYARYPAVYAIKAPVFSFAKLHNVDTILGPEMKSTGEVLGLAQTYAEAMFKAILASGFRFPKRGEAVLLSVKDPDKNELLPLAWRLYEMGFTLYATGGTANYLLRNGVPANSCRKLQEPSPNTGDLLRSGKIKLLVNTASGNDPLSGGFRIRRMCIEHGIPTITSLDTLTAVVECLERNLTVADLTPCDIRRFARLVASSRQNKLPLNELPMQNQTAKENVWKQHQTEELFTAGQD
ncbi:MAG: carbamoyl-phosphate synthase large subunit [Oscillospiraceae bacterium]|nr:carbamoyl-phosphate synthase large subunit [Oscillospiraceae bacterium]